MYCALFGWAGAIHFQRPGWPSSRQPPNVLSAWQSGQSRTEIVELGRSVGAVVHLAVIDFESEALAAARPGAGAVPHDERHIDGAGDVTGGLGHRLDVEAFFDQVAQAAFGEELGGGEDRDRPDALDLTQLVTFGRAPAQGLGVDDDQRLDPGRCPAAAPRPAPPRSSLVPAVPLKMSIRASIRWASRESPAAAPAAFQRALASASSPGATRAQAISSEKNSPRMPPFSSWCQRKYRWLCTRARRTRSVSRLLLAARSLAAVSETSCWDAPCPIRSSKDSVASGTSVAVLTTTPSWSGESSDSWSASVSRGSAAARSAAARRPLALAAEVPESEPSHSWAEPWPPLANEPVCDHPGREQRHPRGGRPLDLGEGGHDAAGLVPRDGQRLGLTHQLLEVAEECIDFVAECRVAGSRVSGSRAVMIGVVLVQGGHVVRGGHVVGGCHERR